MARKKKITKQDIYSFYMDYFLEHGESPRSVFQLAKLHNFDEAQFYESFGTLNAVEKSIFKSFLDQTLTLLDKSQDFANFDARNKMLTFYFTFFEILTANRSFVLGVLERDKNNPKLIRTIASFKPGYLKFVKNLEIEKLDLKDDRLEKIMGRSVEESFWVQFILCFKFWMEDDSASLEKTDIFIEKSINTAFDLMNVQPLKSVIDLGKFLFHEKMCMN